MNAASACTTQFEIHVPVTGGKPRVEQFTGTPRLMKRCGDRVRFLLAGRTFEAAVASWNGRGRGFIEVLADAGSKA